MIKEILSAHGYIIYRELPLVKRDQPLPKAIQRVEHRGYNIVIVSMVKRLHSYLFNFIKEVVNVLDNLHLKKPMMFSL